MSRYFGEDKKIGPSAQRVLGPNSGKERDGTYPYNIKAIGTLLLRYHLKDAYFIMHLVNSAQRRADRAALLSVGSRLQYCLSLDRNLAPRSR